MNGFTIGGYFTIDCYDAQGRRKWSDRWKNGVTNVGINTGILDVAMRQQSQLTWYVGLIDNSGFSALAAADTMASHAGWTELAAYNEATRVTWGPAAAASQAIANSVTCDFTMNASNTVKGCFLNSVSTKSGSTGTLLCTAAATEGNRSVVNLDVLKVTYTISAASA